MIMTQRKSFQSYMNILNINKLILVTLLAIMLPGLLLGLFGVSYCCEYDISHCHISADLFPLGWDLENSKRVI